MLTPKELRTIFPEVGGLVLKQIGSCLIVMLGFFIVFIVTVMAHEPRVPDPNFEELKKFTKPGALLKKKKTLSKVKRNCR